MKMLLHKTKKDQYLLLGVPEIEWMVVQVLNSTKQTEKKPKLDTPTVIMINY